MAHVLRFACSMTKSRRKIRNAVASQASDSQRAGDTTAATINRARVAERAYELYLARGGGDGLALDDWLSAERELTGRVKAP
jgi:hypothetical protein